MAELRASSVDLDLPPVTRWAVVGTLLVVGIGAQAALAQAPAAAPENKPTALSSANVEPDSTLIREDPGDTAFDPAAPSEDPAAESAHATLSRGEDIALFEAQKSRFEVTDDDARDLFNHYRDETRLRLWQFKMALTDASSTSDIAIIDPATLEAQHPGFPAEAYQLPAGVVTVLDLHNDMLDSFRARNRMLELISPALRAEAVGSALYGMQELRSELDLIVLEMRYQALRVPQAARQIQRMAIQAPVPLIWIVVEFWLAIFLFRWWRRWFPATLERMRNSLLAIRPRTEEIMTRLRGLWYINQVRAPIEWLLLLTFLFRLMQFDGLEFVRDLSSIVVQWILLTWFAVALLNAYVARSAGGMASQTAVLRLKSMRLVAGWLLLLGVGIDLSDDLVGDAALTAWIWRIFQLLIFPLVCALLSIWHTELYTRLERESKPAIPRNEYDAQRGMPRWIGSAKVLGLLLASRLRAELIRRIEQFGPVRAAAGLALPDDAENVASEGQGLPADMRATLIKGHDAFSKYASLERRALIKRIEAGLGAVVGVIGERGIGKNGFLRQVASAHERESLLLDCRTGNVADVVADFGKQLGIDMANTDDKALNAALDARNIRFIGLLDFHLLVRPVMGGIGGVADMSELQERITVPLVWAVSIDRYAYELIARLRSEYMLADGLIHLRAWSEDQIGEFIQNRCESSGLRPDFSKVRVPRQYMDVAQDAIEDRNRVGIDTMLTALSRGNPSIAIRMFADCIRMTDDGVAEVTCPVSHDDQRFKDQPINMLLVLRVIAQVELITFDDIVANLRLEPRIVTSALQVAMTSGWVESRHGRYRISWPWFRVIIQVLARQNLLAGVREAAV